MTSFLLKSDYNVMATFIRIDSIFASIWHMPWVINSSVKEW